MKRQTGMRGLVTVCPEDYPGSRPNYWNQNMEFSTVGLIKATMWEGVRKPTAPAPSLRLNRTLEYLASDNYA
eukprot:5630667-Pleurochrysis_carterae.AAC.1